MSNSKISYISAAILLACDDENWHAQPLSAQQWREKLIDFLDRKTGPCGYDFSAVITHDDITDVFECFSDKGLLKRYDDPNTATYWEIEKEPAIGYMTGDLLNHAHKYIKLGDDWLFEALRNLSNKDKSEDNLAQLAEGGGLVVEDTASPEIVDGDMISALGALSDEEQVDEGAPAEATPKGDDTKGGNPWGNSWGRAPASDRVVPLDHNAPEYQKFQQSLEDVIKEFREDHSFGNEPPLDRDVVLGELDAGKKLVAEGAARPRTIKELLAPALKWLSEEFAKKSIGELAKIAMKALLTWLKVIS